MTEATGKRGRGRPAVHVDGAARQAAWRERQQIEAAEGWLALQRVERPTLPFVQQLVARLLERSGDPAAVRRALMDQLADPDAAGAGGVPTT